MERLRRLKKNNEMNQEKYLYTTDALDLVFEREKRIVVYGVGDYGKRLVDYAIIRGYKEKILSFVVTDIKENEYDYQGIIVVKAHDFLADRECFVIVAVSDQYQEDVVKIVEYYGKKFCYLTEDIYRTFIKALEVPYHGLDFMLAGFQKCATSSLQTALETVDDIFLPKEKETFFYTWWREVDDFQGILAEKYYCGIRKYQIVGLIEPGICEGAGADLIYDNFGSQLKLLFLIRNPVEAAFSSFKMAVRNGEEYCDNAYSGHQCFSMQMFDGFIDNHAALSRFDYFCWINECARYYPREQIKVVLFEELIEDTSKVLNDILQFVGSKCKYRSIGFPFRNRGDYVPANKEGWEKGHRYDELSQYSKYNPQAKGKELDSILKSKQEYETAEKIFNPQMSQQQRKKLEIYYSDSVRELEKFLGRSLSELWF